MNVNNMENPSEPIGPTSQNSDVPSNHTPQSNSNDASNAPKDPADVNSEVSSATESIDTSVNQANAPLPDNSTIPPLPDNSTMPSLPDNSTIPSLPDNSTIPSLPDNSTIPSLPDNSTIPSLPDNSTTGDTNQNIPTATQSFQFDELDTDEPKANIDLDDGINGTSLKLEGECYLIENGTSTRELTELTLSAWVKPDYSHGSPEFTVVSKGNAFVLAINNNIPPQKVAKFSVYDGISWHNVESTSQIKEEWTHLAATFDDSSISIYVNGKLENTIPIESKLTIIVDGKFEAVPVDSISSDSHIIIGAYIPVKLKSPQVRSQFSGLIDNVQLYDSLLDLSQITLLYEQNKILNDTAIPVSIIEIPSNSTDILTNGTTLDITNGTTL